VENEMLIRFVNGIQSHGETLKATSTHLLSANNTSSVVEVRLTEGKNREVRRLFEAVGMNVTRLQRVQIGPIKLGELPPGKWRALTPPEIKSLLSKL
jgi:23S rRNA pseudouridine2605 synthase